MNIMLIVAALLAAAGLGAAYLALTPDAHAWITRFFAPRRRYGYPRHSACRSAMPVRSAKPLTPRLMPVVKEVLMTPPPAAVEWAIEEPTLVDISEDTPAGRDRLRTLGRWWFNEDGVLLDEEITKNLRPGFSVPTRVVSS